MRRSKLKEFSKRMYLFNVGFVSLTVAISFVLIALSGKLRVTDLSAISTIVESDYVPVVIEPTVAEEIQEQINDLVDMVCAISID